MLANHPVVNDVDLKNLDTFCSFYLKKMENILPRIYLFIFLYYFVCIFLLFRLVLPLYLLSGAGESEVLSVSPSSISHSISIRSLPHPLSL